MTNKTPITKIAYPSMGTLRITIKQHSKPQQAIIKDSFSTAAKFPVQSWHQTAFPHFRNEEGTSFGVFFPYRRLNPTMPNNLFYMGTFSQRPRDVYQQCEKHRPVSRHMQEESTVSKHQLPVSKLSL